VRRAKVKSSDFIHICVNRSSARSRRRKTDLVDVGLLRRCGEPLIMVKSNVSRVTSRDTQELSLIALSLFLIGAAIAIFAAWEGWAGAVLICLGYGNQYDGTDRASTIRTRKSLGQDAIA
jgi:hypothetical protein